MHLSTKRNLLIASCYAGILALGMTLGPKFGKEKSTSNIGGFAPFLSNERPEKIEQVLKIIKENYVDPVKTDTLENLAINQVLTHLDPHSSYLPPIQARDQTEDLEGNYTGIGIEYMMLNDTLLVTSVSKGPARRAGIKAGDRIVQIDKATIAGIKIKSSEIVSMIKGRTGTNVELLIKPRGFSDYKTVSVKRDKIIVSSIDAAYIISPSTAYIKISRFGSRTDEDFATELGRLQSANIKSLILDLRHNGGGYLSAATALADEFLGEKQLIVYTQGVHEPRTDYFATSSGKFQNGKLIVLIDETSASASEVLAGALQDLDRGTIIGRRSFGKGLVQEQFNFGDGSALNLTVARYYTPLGRSIQRPYKMTSEEYFEETSKRLENREVDEDGSLKDTVYKRNQSFRTASGRILYGGGGINPDIYIPVDTSSFNAYFYALRARGIITEFIFKDMLTEYRPSSLDDLIKNFRFSDNQFKRLVATASKKGVTMSSQTVNIARKAISSEVKASLARLYFDDEAYFRVLNADDSAITRSLQELKQQPINSAKAAQ